MRFGKLAGLALLGASALASMAVLAQEPAALPPAIAAKIAGLPQAKRDFLASRATNRFVPNRDELHRRLAAKTPEEIERYVDAMMSVVEGSKFHQGDMAAIPLNPESPQFNAWKTLRPKEFDPKREPGPFLLSRYAAGWGGIRTLFGLPVAITPEDLKAGAVDVAIVGAPLNMGSGTRGAQLGPSAIRNARMGAGNDMYTMISPAAELNMVDYGDIAVDNMSTERTVHHVREQIATIARTGAIPIIIGGDHSLEYSDVAGLADVHGKNNIGVVHFDSHYDAARGGVHLISHGQPVYRLIREGHVRGRDYIQVGLRASSPDADTFEWMREEGFRYHTMVEVEKSGWPTVARRALAEAKEGGRKIFVSFDIDVLDPAYMVGTGTPVPTGITMREVVPLIRELCAETNLVGFELVELDPTMDPTYASALNSAYIVHACLAGIALRKTGNTTPHYLSPLSSEHDQDNPARKRKAATPPRRKAPVA